MSKDIHKWSDGRYTLMFDEHTFFVWDNEKDERMCALETTERLNMQQATIQELERKVKKYAKIGEEQLKQIIELQETETFTFPQNCDECDFLGGNGICGYCKFTLQCYDSKEDLIDGEVLPNCPLKPLINVLNEQQSIITEYEDFCYNLCMFIIGKDLDDEFREKYGEEYNIITKWKGCGSGEV